MLQHMNDQLPMTALLYLATTIICFAGGVFVGKWWTESFLVAEGRTRSRMCAIGLTLALVVLIGEIVRGVI